jgi:hypothetical protein
MYQIIIEKKCMVAKKAGIKMVGGIDTQKYTVKNITIEVINK